MLEELDVKNFALIDSAHIEFSRGFTVLSGETGAGKSILIGSLAFLLGGKAGLEQIRSGCHEAQVSGVFLLEKQEAFDWLEQHGIESEDGRILLRRIVRDVGKSSAWIGGTPVSKNDLASFAAYLVDIHGQHEQQSLMRVPEHRRFLDVYAGIEQEVADFSARYAAVVEKRRVLEDFTSDERERRERLEILQFAVNEIDGARLKEHEDEELAAEEGRLSSFEKLYGSMEEIKGLFDGAEDDSGGILFALKRVNAVTGTVCDLDSHIADLQGRLQSAFYEIDDIADEFRRYAHDLVFDPERLAQVQERLDYLYRLKKKYASTPSAPLSEVIAYGESARAELERLSAQVADKSVLEKEVAELERQLFIAATAIRAKRKASAESMAAAVEAVLARLGMKTARFRVSIQDKPGDTVTQKCGPYGMDDVEFLISANPGSPLLPLAKVASGGELSRVMLALKSILSDGDLMGTLVFDEIDTGIGGEIAVGIGEHLKKLSQKKQVLCITHLASIAVFADNQIKIQKGQAGDTTATTVFAISGQERVTEIARMLSGDTRSQASLEHAAAMLQKFGGI